MAMLNNQRVYINHSQILYQNNILVEFSDFLLWITVLSFFQVWILLKEATQMLDTFEKNSQFYHFLYTNVEYYRMVLIYFWMIWGYHFRENFFFWLYQFHLQIQIVSGSKALAECIGSLAGGMSSFPLTNIFQRGWNHQPVIDTLSLIWSTPCFNRFCYATGKINIVATGLLVWFGNPVRPSWGAGSGEASVAGWFGTWFFVVFFPWVLGISWSQLTSCSSFFRGVEITKQVDICWYLLICSIYFWFDIVDPLAWLAKENCNMGQLCDSSHSWVIYWYTRWTFAWYR